MFREIKDGIIESSEGFVVNNHGHFELTYAEGDHTAKFSVEPGVGGYIYYLHESVHWEPPFDAEAIDAEHQECIKDRIVAALKYRGYPVHVQR
jgi:hypothetical protein